ncbi:MAG: L-threonine 3-dehydrogenase [Endozoicomonadaceae bacterium]|nr:L-threonine 3-dehydrogenase [Endozoicomonadaceae bacterium]
MKALIKAKPTQGIWMADLPIPKIGVNDVLIRMNKTAICGTDIHIYQWDDWAQKTIPLGMCVGHEFAGEIVEIGSEVTGLACGQRVSGEGHLTCNYCRNCRAGRRHLCRNTIGVGVNTQGAFAEYLCLPVPNVYPLLESISDELASIFDPFGNAVHTTLSFDLIGEDVLITGAGPIGIMAALVAQKAGARYVILTDVNSYRINLAKSVGIKHVINIQETNLNQVMHDLGMLEGFDVGLEMSGNSIAFSNMIDVMDHGGKIALLGILDNKTQINWDKVIFKSLIIKGIYGREIFETWYKMTSLIQSGLDVSGVITHRFSCDEYQQAFDIAVSGQSGKVILDWNN